MEMGINLSEKQRQIVEFTDGPLLVQAGPGSGKTRVLIERIKRLLSYKKRTKVLALTFSNMAAEEMKNRINDGLPDSELIDNVTVGTIHSFCLDIVQNRGYLIGLPENLTIFENPEDRKTILKEICLNNPYLLRMLDENGNPDKEISHLLVKIEGYKKKFIFPHDPSLSISESEIYELYNQSLLMQGAIDFDDILMYAYRILSENKNVAALFTAQYRYICIDEAQDLNFAQYQVIRAVCGTNYRNIMMVGDTKQSIYGFNGSDSSLMSEQFVKDYSPKIFYLSENFRSSQAIVNFANTLEDSSDYTNCYYKGELTFETYENEESEATAVCNKIIMLMSNGHPDVENKINYSDIAIIARNKYVLNHIVQALTDHNMPFYFKRTTTGIESESNAFKQFDLELRLCSNSRDLIHAQEMKKLSFIINDDSLTTFIHSCASRINEEHFDLKPVLQEIIQWAENTELPDEEKYLIIHDGKLWLRHWEKYTGQVKRESRSITSFRNYVALGKTQITEDTTGITLLTAHMSKGLQFEVVFVIGLSDGTFPDYRALQTGGEAMEQEKNNMFVAVTRAKRLCYLSNSRWKEMPWGGTKMQKASRFVASLIR